MPEHPVSVASRELQSAKGANDTEGVIRWTRELLGLGVGVGVILAILGITAIY